MAWMACAAKLTGAVNIAVFAAFEFCAVGVRHPNAGFKRLCRPLELDVLCYGRQKRQDPARSGKVGGKIGKVSRTSRHIHASTMPPDRRLPWGEADVFASLYAIVQVLAAPGGVAKIELNYHKTHG